MVVLVLSACPPGLRGHVTRWLLEISAGVFVGKISPRVRDSLWDQVVEYSRNGRAIMVFRVKSEQGLGFRVHQPDWEPIDMDGLSLVLRPGADNGREPSGRRSLAMTRRRARKPK